MLHNLLIPTMTKFPLVFRINQPAVSLRSCSQYIVDECRECPFIGDFLCFTDLCVAMDGVMFVICIPTEAEETEILKKCDINLHSYATTPLRTPDFEVNNETVSLRFCECA